MINPYSLRNNAREMMHGVKTDASVETTPSVQGQNLVEGEKDKKVIIGATTSNFINNILLGAVKSLEGIVDAGAMLVGLFGADVDNFVSHDFSSDLFGLDEEGEGLFETSWGKAIENASLFDNDSIVNQVAEGVGGMLPTVLLTIATAGTGTAATASAQAISGASKVAKVGQIASKAAFIAGASGNAAESALQEGATYGQALGYGALSGAIEVGTEMIGGRVFGNASTASVDKTLLGKLGVAKAFPSKTGQRVYNFASEGLEEVIADLLDPVNKRVTGVDKEAKIDWAELPKTFLVGGAVGQALDGFQSSAVALKHRKEGGKHFVNISEKLNEIADVNKVVEGMQGNKKISADKLDSVIVRGAERTMDAINVISDEFKSMSDEKRQVAFKIIKEYSPFVDNVFNEDGSIKDGVIEKYEEVKNGGAKYNVSSNLLYKNKELEDDIRAINEKENKTFELSDTNFTEEQRKNFAVINKNIVKLSEKIGKNLEVVVVKENKDVNAFIAGDRIYIGEDHLQNGKWARYLAHEISHFARKSREFNEFAGFIMSDKKSLLNAVEIVKKNYGLDFSESEMDEIFNKLKNNERLTENENEFYDEVVAHLTEELLVDEKSIERLARENKTLAQKILNKIKDLLAIFKGSNAEKDTVERLKKAESLLEKALGDYTKEAEENSSLAVQILKLAKEKSNLKAKYDKLNDDEKPKFLKKHRISSEKYFERTELDDIADEIKKSIGVDNSEEIKYSYKGKRTAQYINKQLDKQSLSFIRDELHEIYGPIDSAIADGIAIEKDNTIFVVDSGIEDGHVEFGVREKIIISDKNLRKVNLEKINDRAISKGYVSIEISRRIKHSSDNDSNSSVGRELSKELSDNTRKSQNNENGIFEKDATDRSGRLKFSTKDKYQARDPKTVTEKEFKHHYWAVANNLLSKEELGVLNSAIGNISRGEVYEKNADGLYMIPVGENQVYNKVVFTNGNQSSYTVDYIVEIHCEKESNLDNALGLLYEQEKNGIPTKTTNLFKIHYSKDFRFSDFRANLGKSSENSGRKQDGTRSDEEVRFSRKGAGDRQQEIDKSLKESVAGLQEIKIDDVEAKELAHELKRRNGNSPSEIDWAATDENLYIVKGNSLTGYTPIVKINVKKHYDFILHLYHMIDYNNYNNEKLIDSWLKEIFNHSKCLEFVKFDADFSTKHESVAATQDVLNDDKPNYTEFDNKGRRLTREQIEYYKYSKVRDKLGRLIEVYHGTYGEFYTFDKALLGRNFGADAKLGFFFTALKSLAEDYSENAKIMRMHNLAYKVAKGDTEVVDFLLDNKNLYDDNAMSEFLEKQEIEELKSIKESLANNNHDVFSVYLNITNPYIEDWGKLGHSKVYMLKAITKALKNGHDGVIIRRINSSVTQSRPASELYVAFEPNQIKLVTNKKPTENPDIRFSLKSAFGKLVKYSEDETVSIEKNSNFAVAKSYTDIKNFVDNVQNFNIDKSLFLGKISNYYAKKILDATGIEVWDKSIVLNSSNLKHIFKNHGNTEKESLSGQIAIGNDNVEDVIETLLTPDTVERSDLNGQTGILFKKNIGGRITAITILSEKKKALTLTSAWIIKNKQHISPTTDEKSSVSTSVTGWSMNAVSNNSILNPKENVNTNLENSTNNKAFTKNQDIRLSKKITAGMTDSERYDILKNKKIENIPIAKELTKEQLDNIQSITSFEDLNKYFGAEKRSIIKKIASEFGVFKEYYNKDIELEFEFSKGNYNESYQKQKHNFISYAKMFSVFDNVIEKAVGIEVHNKNLKGYKFDPTLKNVYVLASAFIDKESIIPVKLEIKEFNDKNNKLYVAIALDKIKKTEVLEDRDDLNKEVAHSSLSVNISIRDLLKNVNPNDKDFYKYIPKQFFDEDSEIIRFSKKERSFTNREVQKKVANLSREKVYSRKETELLVHDIIEEINIDGYKISLSGKKRSDIIDKLWIGLNSINPKQRKTFAEKIADFILSNAVAESISAAEKNKEDIQAIKEKYKTELNTVLNVTEIAIHKEQIVQEVLSAFKECGEKSKFKTIINDLINRYRATNKLLYQIEGLKALKEFKNATQFHTDQFKGSIEKLARLNWRGNLNESSARKIVASLNSWYSKDNSVVCDKFDVGISEKLNEIAEGEGMLDSDEIADLANIVLYFKNFIKNFGKIHRDGKWVDSKPIAEDYVAKMQGTKKLKIGWFGQLFDKWFNNRRHSYIEAFFDPMSLARYIDKYGDGFYTSMMEYLRKASVMSAVLEFELNEPIEIFYEEHKNYLKGLKEKTIKYNGTDIPLAKAISLYMSLNRDQAILGLARSGFVFESAKDERVEIKGFAVDENLTFDELKKKAKEEQAYIEKQLSEMDLEYINVLEGVLSKCRGYKEERDIDRLGFSNVAEGYYFPLKRADTAKSIDSNNFFGGDRVSNLPFNKSTVKGAQSRLFIDSVVDIMDRHTRGVALYYHCANAIQTYDVLYNLDVSGNKNAPVSIATVSANIWKNGNAYFKELIADMQGVEKGDGAGVYGFIRKGFAKFQLGANPKVWLTQLSSFFSAGNILEVDSIVKGFTFKAGDVDEYCALAKLRNNDNSVAMAQGVLEKTDKVGDILMKPVGIMDRFVIVRLFAACQVQIEKNTGLKLGTEENKIKAGELLEKVILETQQNSLVTEKSKAMRSSSEFMKTITMFTSDAMKAVCRVIDAYGKISVLKARLRASTDKAEIENLKKQIKEARIQACRSTICLVSQATFMAIIADAFKYFYNRDEEDENFLWSFLTNIIGNLFSGLPIFKDVYGKLVEGYEFDSFAFSSIEDLLSATSSIVDLSASIVSGNADNRGIASNIKKISYAVGQIFGIPARNLYNVFYGTSNLISPEFAYKIDDIFYKQGYNSDLKKAIKNNDEEMIATIAGLIMDENIGAFENGSTRNEVNRLLSASFDVLPQTVGNTMTINEGQYALTGPQQEKFRKAYSGAITAVDKLVSSNGYKIATDEAKAKAIKYVYRYYYYEAQHQVLNVDLESKLYLFGQIVPIEKMALALAEVPLLVENSTNKKTAVQRYLQASKLTSAQKYMLMGYFGYKNTNGENLVKNIINGTMLSRVQKEFLLEKCGY